MTHNKLKTTHEHHGTTETGPAEPYKQMMQLPKAPK